MQKGPLRNEWAFYLLRTPSTFTTRGPLSPRLSNRTRVKPSRRRAPVGVIIDRSLGLIVRRVLPVLRVAQLVELVHEALARLLAVPRAQQSRRSYGEENFAEKQNFGRNATPVLRT